MISFTAFVGAVSSKSVTVALASAIDKTWLLLSRKPHALPFVAPTALITNLSPSEQSIIEYVSPVELADGLSISTGSAVRLI